MFLADQVDKVDKEVQYAEPIKFNYKVKYKNPIVLPKIKEKESNSDKESRSLRRSSQSITSSKYELMNGLEKKVHGFIDDLIKNSKHLSNSSDQKFSWKDLNGPIRVYTNREIESEQSDPNVFDTPKLHDKSTQTAQTPSFMKPYKRRESMF